MSRAYSTDLRERVIAAVAGIASARSAAALFGIGLATAVGPAMAGYRRADGASPGQPD